MDKTDWTDRPSPISNQAKEPILTDWTKYSCEIPTGARILAPNCAVLDDVRHVAHVADARRIIEDGKIKAQLVYDESRLNQTRMHVCWVSPNHWNNGSIYGTVEFHFRWSDIVKGRSIYWVEAMTGYNPPAYRFLLTDRDANSLKHVVPYDPRVVDGPLKRNSQSWFWNGNFTAEFMIDADLSLDICHQIRFINHNPRICRSPHRSCDEQDRYFGESAARIIGHVIGSGIKTVNKALLPDIGLPNGRLSMTMVNAGVNHLFMKLGGTREDSFSGQITSAASANHIVRSAMLQYAIGAATEARSLVALLASDKLFEGALIGLVKEHFDLTEFGLE